jgi:hypothetical protein
MAQDVTRSGGFAVIKSFLRPRLRSAQSSKRVPSLGLRPSLDGLDAIMTYNYKWQGSIMT